MNQPTVSLVRCDDYALERVEQALLRLLEPLGGMGALVRAGQRVVLKPNLVRAMAPELAATTHPALVAAVARQVMAIGAQAIIADSAGGPFTRGVLKNLYHKTGMDWAAEVSGAELNWDTEGSQVPHPSAQVLHRLDLIQPILQADAVINLGKLKTHNLTALTLCVKNLFGVVPGALKIGYHAKLQDRERFCLGLLDILAYVHPVLHILDAIVGMEGEGPSGGDPRAIGLLLAGTDALAVDLVATAAVGFQPRQVLTTRMAIEQGLTTGLLEDVALVGEAVTLPVITDFRQGIEAAMDPGLLPKPLRHLLQAGNQRIAKRLENVLEGETARRLTYGWVWRQLAAQPNATERCIGCGFCVRHCPVQAITLVDNIAVMDHRICIRCYCCHELCPELAIDLERPWLGRLLLGR
jgi:uncharacterized protein (DUF362 family)/ferredoxin